MKIIIGLGNPGKKYEKTRHNLGFFIIKKFYQLYSRNFSSFKFKKQFNAKIAEGTINQRKIILVMPQTFMNDSGLSVEKLVKFYKINPEKNILIIYDDIDLPLGSIRKKGKSSGGHKGMESIIQHLKTNKIPRLRCGILSKPKKEIKNLAEFVLKDFSIFEQKIIEEKTLLLALSEIKNFIFAS